MQVYKTFFKILWKQKGQIIMYIVIFSVIANLISKQANDDKEKTFSASSYDVAIFDYDDSEASKSIVDYMSKINKIVDIKADNKEVIQDELYNRNISAAIRIPKGFQEKMLANGAQNTIEIVGVNGTIYLDTIENQVNGFVSSMGVYVASGFSITDAIDATYSDIDNELQVDLLDTKGSTVFSKLYYSFLYIAYVFILIILVSIGPILIVFNKKNIKDRIACSSYKLSQTNFEILLGIITAGIALCLIFTGIAISSNGSDVFSTRGALFILNMICFTAVSIGITFIAGQLVKTQNALSMIGNIVGLGSSFLCGVFVPLEFLGDGVKNIARFFPSYWYVLATREIDKWQSGTGYGTIARYMVIQIAFSALFIIVGVGCSIYKRKKV